MNKADKINAMLKSQAKIYLGGNLVAHATKIKAKGSLKTSSQKCLGNKTDHLRITGYTITVEMGMYKVDDFGLNILKRVKNGATPSCDIEVIETDTSSDYYKKYGAKSVVLKDCVPTGDISLADFEASSTDFVEETIAFQASDFA